MKKIICAALLFILCLLLAACGGRSSHTGADDIAPTITPQYTIDPEITPASATVAPATVASPIPTATSIPTPAATVTPIPTAYTYSTPTPTTQLIPTITKNPTAETVTEGATAIFIARASSYTSITWQLISPDGNTVLSNNDIAVNYPRVTVQGIGTDTLKLVNVPATLNGWKARAVFTTASGSTLISDAAVLNVSEFFTQIPHYYEFSSGAGGWRTVLNVYNDGTFTGTYTDFDGTNTYDDDPTHGQTYICEFSGQFSNPQKIDGYRYSVELTSLNYTLGSPYFSEADSCWYVPSEPYGLTGGTSFTIILPGISLSSLPSDFAIWSHIYSSSSVFNGYAIMNNATNEAFISS